MQKCRMLWLLVIGVSMMLMLIAGAFLLPVTPAEAQGHAALRNQFLAAYCLGAEGAQKTKLIELANEDANLTAQLIGESETTFKKSKLNETRSYSVNAFNAAIHNIDALIKQHLALFMTGADLQWPGIGLAFQRGKLDFQKLDPAREAECTKAL